MTVIEIKLDEHTLERLADKVAARVGQGSEGYLSAKQAAQYLSCPPSRIYDLVSLRQVRFVKDGRRTLFRREWLDECLESV